MSKEFFLNNNLSTLFNNSTDVMEFRNILKVAKNIIVITGAGISAESGVPTFRGSGGFWRKYKSQSLATLEAFKKNPSLVWEFYHYRRELCLKVQPNAGHLALASLEARCTNEKKQFTLITQNVDGLHERSGSKNIIEFHGSLYKTRCILCGNVSTNFDSPICESLRDHGAPDKDKDNFIEEALLPRCKDCEGLLRPHVVWFGESIPNELLKRTQELLDTCDLCLVIGTSAVVMPIASFPVYVSERGVPVAEFNIEATPISSQLKFSFIGPSAENLPIFLSPL